MDPVATETLQAQPEADAAALQAQPVAYQQPDGVAVPTSGAPEAALPNGSAEAHGVQAAADASQTGSVQGEQPAVDPKLEEFEREFRKARENPADFDQWMAVEKLLAGLGDIEKSRQVYDGLLSEFPLCYGYWKKYADAEAKYTSPEWAVNVYERGAAAVPYSPDLWGYYCTYKQKIGGTPEEIRELFERGLAYVGTDYLAHILWDKYIKFEMAQHAFSNVTAVYLRALSCPLKELDRYFSSFKQDWFAVRPAADLMSPEEYSTLEAALRQAKEAHSSQPAPTEAAAAQPTAATAGPGSADGSTAAAHQAEQPGEAVHMEIDGASQPGQAAADASAAAVVADGAVMADGAPAEQAAGQPDAAVAGTAVLSVDLNVSEAEVKAHWLTGVDAMYEAIKAELGERKQFEDLIRRPYFHVKPLDQGQLAAWNNYIDYILKKDDAGAIVRLFERCLVACASYPEFWMRYVRYLEVQDPATAQHTIQRAQQAHCKRNALFQLFAAKFEERTGNVDAARSTYRMVVGQLSPGLVEAVVEFANFERRQGDVPAAKKVYEDALTAAEAKEGTSDTGPLLAMFYAHFLHLDCEDAAGARGIYERALQRWAGLRYLWEGAIHFEEHCLGPQRAERVMELFRKATALPEGEAPSAGELADEDREILSKRHLDFADRHASAQTIAELAATLADCYPKYGKKVQSRKRAATSAAAEEPGSKKAAADGTPTQDSAAAAVANGSSAATAVDPGTAAATSTSEAYTAVSDAAAYAAQPAASVAAYYPTASAAAYSYGYYPGYAAPQQYGYAYPGYYTTPTS